MIKKRMDGICMIVLWPGKTKKQRQVHDHGIEHGTSDTQTLQLQENAIVLFGGYIQGTLEKSKKNKQ